MCLTGQNNAIGFRNHNPGNLRVQQTQRVKMVDFLPLRMMPMEGCNGRQLMLYGDGAEYAGRVIIPMLRNRE
jgi:hypothetical protein